MYMHTLVCTILSMQILIYAHTHTR